MSPLNYHLISYLQLAGDGGEANVVVTKSGRWCPKKAKIKPGYETKTVSGSMYGSIRPLSGNVIYAIEACKGEKHLITKEK